MNKFLSFLFVAQMMALASTGYAFDWSACKATLAEAEKLEAAGKMNGVKCKGVTDDEGIWLCIEKMPGGDATRDPKCEKAHVKFENSPSHGKK